MLCREFTTTQAGIAIRLYPIALFLLFICCFPFQILVVGHHFINDTAVG